MSEQLSKTYHTLEFVERTEAAAFVAALSRFLSSPAGAGYKRSDTVRVWATGARRLIQLLLSGAALKAAQAAFASLPAQSTTTGPIPADSVLLVQSDTPALGVEEVLNLL